MPFQKKSQVVLRTADALSDYDKMAEVLACKNSCAYFLNQYGYINDPLSGTIEFKLWPVHLEALELIKNNQRIVILKSRQVGFSWLAAGYGLWRANFFDGANVIMLSKREDEARALLSKSFSMYQALPHFLKRKMLKKNESEFLFLDSKREGVAISGIKAFPSTADAGRSESASDVICDEWAFHPYAEENYGAYKPTIDAGGKLIGLSTANGAGNFFHRIYMGAKQPHKSWTHEKPIGDNQFVPIFIPWVSRPGRNKEWYERQVSEFAETPHLLAQEYPADDLEAFISSGNCYFSTEAISRNMQFVRSPIVGERGGTIKRWKLPQFGEDYLIGADCAEGRGRDHSGIAVYHVRTMEHVADIHGDLYPDEFAFLLVEMASQYNRAFVNIERNSVGNGVLLDILNKFSYKNVFRFDPELHKLRLRQQPQKMLEYGWPTTSITRPVLLRDLASAISTSRIISPDKAFWEECRTFINNDGKLEASQGTKDDRVIKHAIAIQAGHVWERQSEAAQKRNMTSYGVAINQVFSRGSI